MFCTGTQVRSELSCDLAREQMSFVSAPATRGGWYACFNAAEVCWWRCWESVHRRSLFLGLEVVFRRCSRGE